METVAKCLNESISAIISVPGSYSKMHMLTSCIQLWMSDISVIN